MEEIEDEARQLRESNGESFDVILKTNIEGIIVKWGHQVILFIHIDRFKSFFLNSKVDEVLSLASEDDLKNGGSPGPMVEVLFWDAKCYNLESLHEQVTRRVKRNCLIMFLTDECLFDKKYGWYSQNNRQCILPMLQVKTI